jgi:hypothetical protein
MTVAPARQLSELLPLDGAVAASNLAALAKTLWNMEKRERCWKHMGTNRKFPGNQNRVEIRR